MRKLLIALGTVLAAVALAACGGGDSSSKSDDYAKDYKPLNTKLLALGRALNSTVVNAREKSNPQLATEFNSLARDGSTIAEELGKLDPPGDEKANLEELVSSLEAIDSTLGRIANAASKNDPKAANAATQTLVKQSAAVNAAQNKVAADTGAARGAS
jgi:hypothetical protein